MNTFKRNNKFNNRKDGSKFGRKKFSSRRHDQGSDHYSRPAIHRTTCAECGDTCEVPFKPTGERPVFCNTCFKSQGSGSFRSNASGGPGNRRSRFENKQMHDAVCAECGQDCQVPFRPTSHKPIYCDDCFTQEGNTNQKSNYSGEILQEIKRLHTKIDDLIVMFASKIPAEKNKSTTPPKKTETEKTVKVKTIKTQAAKKKKSAKKTKIVK